MLGSPPLQTPPGPGSGGRRRRRPGPGGCRRLPCQPVLATPAGASPTARFPDPPAPLGPSSVGRTGSPNAAARGLPCKASAQPDLVFRVGGGCVYLFRKHFFLFKEESELLWAGKNAVAVPCRLLGGGVWPPRGSSELARFPLSLGRGDSRATTKALPPAACPLWWAGPASAIPGETLACPSLRCCAGPRVARREVRTAPGRRWAFPLRRLGQAGPSPAGPQEARLGLGGASQ